MDYSYVRLNHSILTSFATINQVFAELKDLGDEIASNQLVSPSLIIIGKVVALSPLWPHAMKEASTREVFWGRNCIFF